MNLKTIAAAGFAAAVLALGSVPASANTNATEAAAARDEQVTSNRCGCYRGYVRYYRVYPTYRYYRVRYVRYWYYYS